MAKETNKYAFHTEYDTNKEKAVAFFTKNGQVVSFDELPNNEKNVYRCMLAELVEMIFPEESDVRGESEQDILS